MSEKQKKRRTVTGLAGALALAASLAAAPAGAQRAGPESFSGLARELAPAVVNISTAQTISVAGGGLPEFPPDSPLERFNEFFGGQGGSRIANSLGSGFVIDPSGIVVTNNHVVEGADEVMVNFADGTSLQAEIIGVDPATDLAVLRISSSSPLPYVEFGDSDESLVGDWVVAIGNPFGLGGTLTAGIISARNRNIDAGRYDDFIQTDAAINRGNSGGPLFDMDGQVIGVNTAILSPTGANVGISFSVPSNIAAPIVRQLVEYGVARRGWFGVNANDVTPAIASDRGLDRARGALIVSVNEDGPAAAAGIEADDVILSIDGAEVGNSRDLSRIVAQIDVGRTVQVEYLRGNNTRRARVTVGEMETDTPVRAPRARDAAPQVAELLGMTLAPLTNADRGRLGLAPGVRGVLVTGVDGSSDAAGKVREGDVIEEIAWEPIATLDDARARVEAARAGNAAQIQVVINRRGSLLIRSLIPE